MSSSLGVSALVPIGLIAALVLRGLLGPRRIAPLVVIGATCVIGAWGAEVFWAKTAFSLLALGIAVLAIRLHGR